MNFTTKILCFFHSCFGRVLAAVWFVSVFLKLAFFKDLSMHSLQTACGLTSTLTVLVTLLVWTFTIQENMVITIEPGVYFNHAFVEKGLKDTVVGRYIVVDKVMEFLDYNVGGVCIEIR